MQKRIYRKVATLLVATITQIALASNVLVIGDSMSLKSFGDGLAQKISAQGNTVTGYSVAGSRFEGWLSSSFTSNKFGAAMRTYVNGKKDPSNSANYQQGAERPDWSLNKLIEGKEELVIALGTNHLTDPSPQIFRKRIISFLNNHPQVKKVTFVMPPRTRSNPTIGEEYKKRFLAGYNAADPRIIIADAPGQDAMSGDDFVDDLHLKSNSPTENNWLDGAIAQMYPQSPGARNLIQSGPHQKQRPLD